VVQGVVELMNNPIWRGFMRRSANILITVFCFMMLASYIPGFQTDAVAAQTTIRINGSGTGLDMMKPLIEAYLKSHPEVTFEMEKPLGSSGAIKALIAGVLDIAVTSKPLKKEEEAQGATVRKFGKTPLAIVAGKNVPVTNISTAELENIYSGRTRRWSNNEPIRVVLRPKEDIDTKILQRLSPGMDKAISISQSQQGMYVAVTDPESNQAVLKSDGSIGASGLASIMAGKIPLKVLSLDGVMPDTKSLSVGTYPLSKDLNFVTKGTLSDAAAKFLEFIYSAKARMIVQKIGVLVTADRQAENK
jgi:phosphate transport system substrate-binding protein